MLILYRGVESSTISSINPPALGASEQQQADPECWPLQQALASGQADISLKAKIGKGSILFQRSDFKWFYLYKIILIIIISSHLFFPHQFLNTTKHNPMVTVATFKVKLSWGPRYLLFIRYRSFLKLFLGRPSASPFKGKFRLVHPVNPVQGGYKIDGEDIYLLSLLAFRIDVQCCIFWLWCSSNVFNNTPSFCLITV